MNTRQSARLQELEKKAENGGHKSYGPHAVDVARAKAERTLWDRIASQATELARLRVQAKALRGLVEELIEAGFDSVDENWYVRKLREIDGTPSDHSQ